MNRIVITLNYGPNGVEPDPPSPAITRGTKIRFQKGKNVSPSQKVKVTIAEATAFSRAEFVEGEAEIEVTGDLKQPVVFECDLLGADGSVLPRAKGGTGGTFEPGKGKT